MSEWALPLSIMLLLVLVEMLYLQRNGSAPWRDTVFNLNSGHVLMWQFRGLEILAYSFLIAHVNLHWINQWSNLWQWVFGFVAWDFCFYWMHRLHHKLPFLWSVHVVHHQGEHFNLSLGIRNSWYSSLSNFPFIAILAVLGLPTEIFVIVSSIHYGVQFYNHNGFIKNSGWLDSIMVTPKHHRVHHGLNDAYIDKNFGGTLLIWDKLFGSFQVEQVNAPMTIGTHDTATSRNPFWASNLPYLSYFKLPKPRFTSANPLKNVSDGFVVCAGFILFAAVIYSIYAQAHFKIAEYCVLCILMFIGTLAIGALSDNQRWGLYLWASIALILSSVMFLWSTSWFGYGLAIGLLLHGCDALRHCLFKAQLTRAN